MIKIENIDVYGFEAAVRGMRNPLNSWDKSDSKFECDFYNEELAMIDSIPCVSIGNGDLALMRKLAKAGTDHSKYLRMINVTMDITAPTFWWAECDTYKVGTVRNSCSKMHKIHVKPFTIEDFSHEGCSEVEYAYGALLATIDICERLRRDFNETQDKKYWRALIELLPEGFNIKATLQVNYEVLRNMYFARENHKLVEWREFCKAIEELPYFKEIFLDEEKCENNIPAENVSELEAAVYALEGIKRERFMEDLKKGNLFEKKDGVTMMTRLPGGIFLPPDSEGGEDDD